ncbi:BolA family protein [Reinekea marinisedimentorum]|uniref:Acid stress-induced BolA-like protein IbaG/YrbA n=1 Tax=Reinekea marinisedimentorum TaxID=230495 RepID=A0A4R3I1A3_9GAMM|nr:BolA/IbaG family iron-sulfur metabolism protein [Reinekea marinisedimentorum]TCS37629.1 acid stress-induced BolA-like protein IbaG/YrbA [Reinekea marinisedimentorum]
MTAEDLKKLVEANFANAAVEVSGEGANFTVNIVSDAFESKRPVQRQQMVYAVLNEFIASGEIHAVTMNLKTQTEAA